MAVKSMSTRASICGRGGGCKGGHSAVGQSSYISREEMYCEYDGLTYYPKYSKIATERTDIKQRMTYLENLLSVYDKYEPYIQYHKEQWALKGFERKKYERKHIAELSYYDAYREHLKKMIVEPDKKITAGAWKKELATLEAKYEKGKQPYAEVVTDLACVEVLQHNKKDLDRILQNERNARERQTTKRRAEPSL